jgi:hypothetical protein
MPKRLNKKPRRSTQLLDRISRALSRHERLLIGLALGVILLVFASFAVVHRLVSGPQLRRWVNSDPEDLLLDYEAGSSWVPGIIRLRGLTIRGSDENVQWWFRMEEVRISVSLPDLLRKRFHATSVIARGLVFRLREKEERTELSAAHLARVPKIPGFSDPPLKTVDRKPPPPPAAARKQYWTVLVENLDADPAPEIWIELYRFAGHGRVSGSFSIRPHVEAWVGPAAVKFVSGRVTLGGKEPLLSSVSGLGTCVIEGYDPERVGGPHVWPRISGRIQMDGGLTDLGFVNYFLRDSKEPRLTGGAGRAQADIVFDHGIGRGQGGFESRDVIAHYGKGTLAGRAGGRLAVTRWDMEKDVLDISGSHIDLTDITTNATAHDEHDWWGHFQFSSAQLHDGLTARTAIDARDARPLYTLFRANLPGWAQGILKLDGIHATARVHLGGDLLELRELEAQGGHFHMAGEYEQRKNRERGAFLVESGLLALGLEIESAASHLHLLGARKWFEETRASWQSLAERAPP